MVAPESEYSFFDAIMSKYCQRTQWTCGACQQLSMFCFKILKQGCSKWVTIPFSGYLHDRGGSDILDDQIANRFGCFGMVGGVAKDLWTGRC